MSIYYDRFIPEWVNRAERQEEMVDDGDRFIALWVAFNGWLRKQYGESRSDSNLLQKVKQHEGLRGIFAEKKEDEAYKELLSRLKRYSVVNMRNPSDKNLFREYDDSFESLIEVVYQIRCNLFHGRKNVDEDPKDFELVQLAYCLLKPLFKEQLRGEHIIFCDDIKTK